MSRLKEIVIATGNPGKIARFTRIFKDITPNVLSLADFGIETKPEEIGTIAEENSQIKATYYMNLINKPVFSQDESLFVDFLPPAKQPGVYVRRIDGKNEATDEELFEYWHQIIANIPKEKRTGKWHVACSIAIPNIGMRTFSVDYPLVFFDPASKIRIPGWPMSSLQGSIKIGKPQAEYTQEEERLINLEAETLIKINLNKLLEIYT